MNQTVDDYLLAVESSTRAASVALMHVAENRLVGQACMPDNQRTVRWLAPAVRELFQSVGVSAKDVGSVALTAGPGSFTGLRIGVTFAKVFCYATSSRLVALDTLEVLARQADATGDIHAVLDAMRTEYFHACFHGATDSRVINRQSETCIKSSQQLIDVIQAPCTIVGQVSADLRVRLPDTVHVVSDSRSVPTASSVAELSRDRVLAEQYDDLWTLVPRYFRKTYAEERRAGQK